LNSVELDPSIVKCAANTAVYVVAGRPVERVNDRVNKLLSLRDLFSSITLVTPGPVVDSPEHLCVPPRVNPTGILRLLGAVRVKAIVDKYLHFPSNDRLFVRAIEGVLFARIAKDLDLGRQATVLLTFPPHALGMLAERIKRRFPSARVVLDWQDLWSFDANYLNRSPKVFRGRVDRMEQAFYQAGDLHLTTNRRAADIIAERYAVPRAKIGYVEHHYHPADLAGIALSPLRTGPEVGQSLPRPLRLGFLGTLDKPPRVPGRELIAAVCSINLHGHAPSMSVGQQSQNLVELHVYGDIPNYSEAQRAELSTQGVEFYGRVTHEEGTRAMANYDALVVLLADLPNSAVVMSIKLPHYLQLERPIIAIVPQHSAIADVIDETKAGVVVNSGGDWSDQLAQLLANGSFIADVERRRQQQAVERYHWDNLKPRWVSYLLGRELQACGSEAEAGGSSSLDSRSSGSGTL